MDHQQVGVAGSQHADVDADRGAGKEGIGRRLDRVGQLHAANVVVLRRAEHAGLGVGSLRYQCGLRQDHLLAVKARLLHIDDPVEGRKFLACDALAGVKHRIKRFPRMVGKTGSLIQALDTQPVVEEKINGGT